MAWNRFEFAGSMKSGGITLHSMIPDSLRNGYTTPHQSPFQGIPQTLARQHQTRPAGIDSTEQYGHRPIPHTSSSGLSASPKRSMRTPHFSIMER
jgi:hypothetical protein